MDQPACNRDARDQTVVLVGGGLGNAVLFSIAHCIAGWGFHLPVINA